MSAIPPDQDDAQGRKNSNERARVCESAARVVASEDWARVQRYIKDLLLLEFPAFQSHDGFNTHAAAMRDGSREVFLRIEHLSRDANKSDQPPKETKVIKGITRK